MLVFWNDGEAPDRIRTPPPQYPASSALLLLMTQPVIVALVPLSEMNRPPPAPASQCSITTSEIKAEAPFTIAMPPPRSPMGLVQFRTVSPRSATGTEGVAMLKPRPLPPQSTVACPLPSTVPCVNWMPLPSLDTLRCTPGIASTVSEFEDTREEIAYCSVAHGVRMSPHEAVSAPP